MRMVYELTKPVLPLLAVLHGLGHGVKELPNGFMLPLLTGTHQKVPDKGRSQHGLWSVESYSVYMQLYTPSLHVTHIINT